MLATVGADPGCFACMLGGDDGRTLYIVANQYRGGGASDEVNEPAEPFAKTLPAISKHIKVLEHAGLVVCGRRAHCRPCALDATPLEDVCTWAEQYRAVWEPSFDRMDD